MYDPTYEGAGIIDHTVGSKTFGRLKIGNAWFERNGRLVEVSVGDQAYLNNLSSHEYEMFKFRHELRYIEPLGLKITRLYETNPHIAIPTDRAKQPWEIDASGEALKWSKKRNQR